ncbi:MAG: acyl-CoA desaturase [Bacteroidia bacterium]|nr:acyl-CoA desaturase [Bacteroidia bacterium]
MPSPPTVIFTSKEDAFYQTLNRRVREYFRSKGISTYANARFFAKGFFLVAVYILAYGVIMVLGEKAAWLLAGYSLMGALAILIGLNLGHDAAHNAISRQPMINRAIRLFFDLLGANSFMWRNRHVFAHHPYPNISDQDSDIRQVGFVRIFPNDTVKAVHRYQHIYMPFVYLLYTLHWLYRRDFVDFFSENIGAFRRGKFPRGEFVKMLAFKVFYLGYVLVIPLIYVEQSWGMILLGWLVMNFSASAVVAIALVSAHVGEDAVFPEPDKTGKMAASWAEHQVMTTSDFATQNPIVNFLFGGFNHHVVHHLFPRVCHIHYPSLTPLVRQTAEEFGLTYLCEPRLGRAILSHWRLLKDRGPVAWNQYEF